ncbi:hypothetical protein AB0K48_50655 [Nonomuraea sp. NPDC055795]
MSDHAAQGRRRRLVLAATLGERGWTVGLLIPVAYGPWALGPTSSLGGEVRPGRPHRVRAGSC